MDEYYPFDLVAERNLNDFDNKSVEKYLSQLTNDKSTEYSFWKTTKKT